MKGVTPDIFYGTYVPSRAGRSARRRTRRAVPRGGLMDCLSVYGSKDRVDANTAAPAVLAAVGLSPYAISALLERRSASGPARRSNLASSCPRSERPTARLRVEGNSMITLRATARLRLPNGQLSDLKRTVVGGRSSIMPPGARFAGPHCALVRHRLEQLTPA